MSDTALFLGFAAPARAREPQALALYEEVTQFSAGLQERGEIAGFEAVLLEPHGGDLAGFFLLRGDGEQLDRLRRNDDFRRLSARAGLVVDGFGVVDAHVGAAVARQMSLYAGQVEEQLGEG